MNTDARFTAESGREIYAGHELVIKGALETDGGIALLTGWRVRPVAGILDGCRSLASLLSGGGMVVQSAGSAAEALSMALGAAEEGRRAIAALPADALRAACGLLADPSRWALRAPTGTDAGVLLLSGIGRQPATTAGMDEARLECELRQMPLLEPTSSQEVKDWIDAGLRLSGATGRSVAMLVGDVLLDGGASVQVAANRALAAAQQPAADPPARGGAAPGPIGRRPRAAGIAEARQLGLNTVLHGPQKDELLPIGFVAGGMGFAYLAHALDEIGLGGRLPILKLGMTWPIDEPMVLEFVSRCRQVIVVEEGRPFIERQIVELLRRQTDRGSLASEVWGKQLPGEAWGLPAEGPLHPSLLIERLGPLLQSHAALPLDSTVGRLQRQLQRIEAAHAVTIPTPARAATFCPGCPQRDVAGVLLDLQRDLRDAHYMMRHHRRLPVELTIYGDEGCNTMLAAPPNTALSPRYPGMGQGAAAAGGAAAFSDACPVVFMGDGTFHQNGQVAVRRSIQSGQTVTYLIAENKTSPPRCHGQLLGDAPDPAAAPTSAEALRQIEQTIHRMVPRNAPAKVTIARIDPADRDGYRDTLERAVLTPGVKVLIADKECGVTRHQQIHRREVREADHAGFIASKTFMNVTPEVCEFCLECTSRTGCTALTVEHTDYGPKVQTDLSWCVNDGACARIEVCPAFEQVTVTRQRAPQRHGDETALLGIGDAPRPIHADRDTWRCQVAGVGGMGVGIATAILVNAGRAMGYHVRYVEDKGTAIGSGGVFSQLLFTRNVRPATASPVIPYGTADVLLGIDLLEAARAVDAAERYRCAGPETVAVVNTHRNATPAERLGDAPPDHAAIESALKNCVRSDAFIALDVGEACSQLLGSKRYVNVMLLGAAFQRGYLPLTLEAIEGAISAVMGDECAVNLRAFRLGRRLSQRPGRQTGAEHRPDESAARTLRRKLALLCHREGRHPFRPDACRSARRFARLMNRTLETMRQRRADESLMRDVVVRAYDCVIWGGRAYARRYCRQVLRVLELDDAAHGLALTRAAAHSLARVMLIKDEVYVAALLTSPEKRRRDRKRFNVQPARGDRIAYRRVDRPEITLFNQRFTLRIVSFDWQLRLVAGCRFVRDLLPGWHRREAAFRDWFDSLIDRVTWTTDGEYERWRTVLELPMTVTGYREVRYPKMQAARAAADAILSAPDDAPPAPAPQPVVSLSARVLSNKP